MNKPAGKLDVSTRARDTARQGTALAQQKAGEAVTQVTDVAKKNADLVASTARQVGGQVQQQVEQLPSAVRNPALFVLKFLGKRSVLLAMAFLVALVVVRTVIRIVR